MLLKVNNVIMLYMCVPILISILAKMQDNRCVLCNTAFYVHGTCVLPNSAIPVHAFMCTYILCVCIACLRTSHCTLQHMI